jgi:hypothetical protein
VSCYTAQWKENLVTLVNSVCEHISRTVLHATVTESSFDIKVRHKCVKRTFFFVAVSVRRNIEVNCGPTFGICLRTRKFYSLESYWLNAKWGGAEYWYIDIFQQFLASCFLACRVVLRNVEYEQLREYQLLIFICPHICGVDDYFVINYASLSTVHRVSKVSIL